MAQLQEQLCDHRDPVLQHLSYSGLWLNGEKGKLSCVRIISFLRMQLDSVSMIAHLTSNRAKSVLNCQIFFRGRTVVTLKHIQRLTWQLQSDCSI